MPTKPQTQTKPKAQAKARAKPTRPTRLTFPSADAPPFPKLAIDCPAGWVRLPVPSAVLAVAERKRGDAFRANVTVAVERVLAKARLDDVMRDSLAALVRAFPDVAFGDGRRTKLAGQPALVKEYAFTHPAAGTLFQVQAVLLAPKEAPSVRDAVIVHGTCAAGAANDVRPVFYDVIGSLACT